jgi:hypothetical protein
LVSLNLNHPSHRELLHSTSSKYSFNFSVYIVFFVGTDVDVFPLFQQHANKTHCHRYERNKALRDQQLFEDFTARGFEVMEADSVSGFPEFFLFFPNLLKGTVQTAQNYSK